MIVRTILAECSSQKITAEDIHYDTILLDVCDSLELLDVAFQLESKFDIVMKDDDLRENIVTVGDLEAHVCAEVAKHERREATPRV